MAICNKCGKRGLEWLSDKGRMVLYNPINGALHYKECTPSNKKIMQKAEVCRHGILKERLCPECENEREQELQNE
jgi:ribosomal protein L32